MEEEDVAASQAPLDNGLATFVLLRFPGKPADAVQLQPRQIVDETPDAVRFIAAEASLEPDQGVLLLQAHSDGCQLQETALRELSRSLPLQGVTR